LLLSVYKLYWRK